MKIQNKKEWVDGMLVLLHSIGVISSYDPFYISSSFYKKQLEEYYDQVHDLKSASFKKRSVS